MRIVFEQGNTIVKDTKDFNIEQTLECGQCFRFDKIGELEYVIVAKGNLLRIKQDGSDLIFFDTDKETVENVWFEYFDLNRDYGEIKKFLLSKDNTLETAIREKYGIRILNQEFHETVISFIISQNKQIPQIKQIVKRISVQYGNYLGEINGEKYYSFPDVKTLGSITESDYREMKTGFRAPYLKDASDKLADGLLCEEMFRNMHEDEARNTLITVKGIGEKVANCVLLFSLGYRNAFPVDVWIKRIMESLYFKEETSKEIIQEFAKNQYGEYGGYAQQYLFCYGRENKEKIFK